MKLGINTYTFMWSIGQAGAWPEHPMTPIGLLRKARELGVRVVQAGPNQPLDSLSEAELDEFAKTAQDWGIELELCTRGIDVPHLTRQLSLATRIGAKLVRTIPEVAGKAVDHRQALPHLREILPVLDAGDINLGLENGKIPANDLRWLVEEVMSPRVGIVLDSVNSTAVPEGWRYVTKTLARYALNLHVKDFSIRRHWSMMGFILEGAPTGQGQLDVPWLLETVRSETRYADFNVIIELWPPEQKTLEETIALEHAWACASVPYMRQFIKE